MTPTPTVDRVARAIATALAEAYAEREEPTEQDHTNAARAAIEALRSLEGIDVQLIYRAIDKTVPENEIGPEEVAAIWRGVLDAALGRGGV